MIRTLLTLSAAFALACAAAFPAGAAEKKRVKKKVQGYDYENSKYKSYKALSDGEPKTYRFDERGNPIPPPAPKKGKKKKKDAADEEESVAPAAEEAPAESPAPTGPDCDANGENCAAR